MSGIMLAATSGSAVLIDIGTLKSDVSACKTPFSINGGTCATFGADGDLYIGSSSGSVDRFDRTGTLAGTVYSGPEPVVGLAVKDGLTLVVALTNSVHIINTITSKIIGGPISARGTIKSLSLSHDKESLSITTESSISIHNLANNTSAQLNLRSLPPTLGTVVFHPSRRSCLVACCGSQLVSFDVNKPGAPLKVTTLGSHSHAVDFIFLPSGKNLLAVAMDNGDVLIVDLDKEKPVTKKIELKQTLSTISASADNMLLFIGTAAGDVLVHDARTAKAICTLAMGTSESVIALASQKRSPPLRATTSAKAVPTTVAVARVLPLGDKNVQRAVHVTGEARKATTEAASVDKGVKARGNVVASITSPVRTRKPVSRVASARSDAESIATSTTRAKSSRPARIIPISPFTTKQVPRPVESANTIRREVSASSSPMQSPALSSHSMRSRKSEERPSALGQRNDHRVSPAYSKTTTERTPSPDLPVVDEVSMVYQGHHTEVAEKDFMEEADTTPSMAPAIAIDSSTPPKVPSFQAKTHDRVEPTPSSSPMYDSPVFLTPDGRHGIPTPPKRKFGSNGKPFAPGVMQLSPMRSPAPRLLVPTSTEAQDFLRKVVREAMLEREEEQREELRALHLDVVKMGRAWKNELRTLMGEYVGDLNAIRLDNERLRAENERLRRGY